MTKNTIIAPEYRYFTADLLTNEILSEIPFGQVSYERSIKGAGNFSGSIPVIAATSHLSLYENTMPGNTALFVVRDGICVWGGIIWSRSYSIVDEVLQVSADEFTSYFFKRKIWKTWNNAFGATVYVAGDLGEVTLDTGTNASFIVGSSVYIEFIDAVDSRLSGYYKVGTNPAPTTSKFYLESPVSVADIDTIDVDSNRVFVTTKSNHGFNTGDKIAIDFPADSGNSALSGEFEIRNTPGANGLGFDFGFTTPNTQKLPTTGTASRRLPSGTYTRATVQIRTDTYDYIRALITAVSTDFTGVDFPNEYIEPGVRRKLGVVRLQASGGFATIDVESSHELVPGQSVVLENTGSVFDGEHTVTSAPTPTRFSYATSGTVSVTDVVASDLDIVSVSVKNKRARITTATPHNLRVGQKISVALETTLGAFDSDFNGEYVITATPSTTTLRYVAKTAGSLDRFSFVQPTVNFSGSSFELLSGLVVASGSPVTASEATLRTAIPTAIAVGSSVSVANANLYYPLTQKTYDAGSNRATVVTASPHGLQVGDLATIQGLQDSSAVSGRQITGSGSAKNVEISTETAHNFKVGDVLTVSDMFDESAITARQITGNTTMTIRTAAPHNLAAANTVFVSGLVDMSNISRVGLKNNIATLTLDHTVFGFHNYRVNDVITVTSLKDRTTIVAKEMLNGVATLTTLTPHNMQVGSEIIVSRVDKPDEKKFNGVFTILNVGPEFIQYETGTKSKIDAATTKYNVALSQAVASRVRNPYADKSVVAAKKILDALVNGAGNVPSRKLTRPGGAPGTVVANYGTAQAKTSVFNGVHTITAVTFNSVSFALRGINTPNRETPLPSLSVTNRSATLTECSLVLPVAVARSLAVGDFIFVPMSFGNRFYGDHAITNISSNATTTTITYRKPGAKVDATVTALSVILLYRVFGSSLMNGEFSVISTPTPTTFTYNLSMTIVSRSATATECTLTFLTRYPISVGNTFNVSNVTTRYNGGNLIVKTVTTSGNNTTITYVRGGAVEANTVSGGTITPRRQDTAGEVFVPFEIENGDPKAVAFRSSIHNGDRTITRVSRTSVTFAQNLSYTTQPASSRGVLEKASIFNVTDRAIIAATDNTITYTLSGPRNNVIEVPASERAYLLCGSVFNGTYTVTDVNEDGTQFTIPVSRPGPTLRQKNITETVLPGFGSLTMKPSAIVSSFGPFPGNADVGFEFSTRGYSGVNILPATYRGFELKTVGEVLNSYSDSINGFEYRVDCVYDADTNMFRKIFVLIPINFPAPPLAGDISPASRFGADKLVFEYPGNIVNLQMNEDAGQSATRFFVLGENDLSADAGPPFSVKASTGFLAGTYGKRRWPLLDEDEVLPDTDDETLLYAQAIRYVTEARPPEGQISVFVNGSLSPVVGTYSPGDWCSVVVDDRFVQQRMRNDIELRDDVIVRKIDGIRVTVPDGTTFPEQVELTIVPEWEVDKRGN